MAAQLLQGHGCSDFDLRLPAANERHHFPGFPMEMGHSLQRIGKRRAAVK